jgi:hypothetical protein
MRRERGLKLSQRQLSQRRAAHQPITAIGAPTPTQDIAWPTSSKAKAAISPNALMIASAAGTAKTRVMPRP